MLITSIFTPEHKVGGNHNRNEEETNQRKPPRMIEDRETVIAFSGALHECGIVWVNLGNIAFGACGTIPCNVITLGTILITS